MKKYLLDKKIWVVGLIGIVTLVCFQYTIHNQFTCWDDDFYVTNDPYIKSFSFENLKAIFTKDITKNNYHPFCMLSLAINYFFTQLNPASYYFTNIIIHIINAVLVFYFIFSICKKLKTEDYQSLFIAGFTSLWFAIHPMHVESVAWIAERKDVLYCCFYVAGLLTYLKYIETSGKKWYWWTLLLFIFSCLSKPMAVVFPLSLLCLDFLLQRDWKIDLIKEKILFFVVSLICGGGAYYTQNATGAIADFGRLSLGERTMYASYGFIMYIYKFFDPTYLSTFYPYPYRYISGYLPNIYYAAPFIAIALPALCILIAYQFTKERNRTNKISKKEKKEDLAQAEVVPASRSFTLPFNPNKYSLPVRVVIFGFCYLFSNLVFVLQFISCGAAIMADRYSYVAYIGFLFMIAFVLNLLINKMPQFKVAIIGLLLVISGWFAVLCYQRTYAWHDSETLLSDAIEKYPHRALLSYKWLGNYYMSIGKLDLALVNYGELTMLRAADAKVCDNMGNIYMQKGDYKSAIESFNESIRYQNNFFKTYLDRANAYTLLGDTLNASRDFEMASRLNPALNTSGANMAGNSYNKNAGNKPVNANQAGIDPALLQSLNKSNLGSGDGKPYLDSCLTQIKAGDTLRAFRSYILAYKFNPGTEKTLAETGFNWVQTKQFDAAINLYGILLKLNTSNPYYFFYRGVAKFSLERTQSAMQDWQIALKMNSKEVKQSASYNLCVAYDNLNQDSMAVYYAEMASSLGYNVTPEYLAKLKTKKKAQGK